MNKKITLFFAVLIMTAGAVYVFFFNQESRPDSNIVFIDNFRVFEEFTLKKEYDSILFQDQQVLKSELDSLTSLIELKSKNPATKLEADLLKKQLLLRQQEITKTLQEKSGKYTGIVYERLNAYIKEYGKMHQYALIVGSDGKGNVMYVDSLIDVSNDIISFINKKYDDE